MFFFLLGSFMFLMCNEDTLHWIPNPEVQCLKPLGDLKVDSAFHPFKVDQMSTKNFWEPSSKK